MSELHTAMSAIIGIMQIAKGAIDARDWTKLNDVTAKLTDQIVKTQQAVIGALATQSDLVTKLANANDEIRQLRTALENQARHSLVEVSKGKFALLIQQPTDKGQLGLEPDGGTKHYACQRCFSLTGKSIVLQWESGGEYFHPKYVCPSCNTQLILE